MALFGCASQRFCHTACSVWWVSIWMRPSGITPGSTRAIVNAAVPVPASVSTGRDMWTRSRTAKAVLGEPPVRGFCVGDGKSRKMQSGVLGQHRVELARQRRVGGLEQHFRVSALEHRGDVAGSGRACAAGRIGIDLNRDRRRRKAAADQRASGRVSVAYEMGDMVEKNFVAGGKLTVDLVRRG